MYSYQSGGIITQKKQPVVEHFKSLEEMLYQPGEIPFTDGLKWDRNPLLHLTYLAINRFYDENNKLPTESDVKKVIEYAKTILKKLPSDFCEIKEDIITQLVKYCSFTIQPVAAAFGGIIAQEIVKFTGKYTPINQWLYMDWLEILPDKVPSDTKLLNSRYDDMIGIYGKEFHQKLENVKTFMIGCGALGCELLKNFALMGIGCGEKGRITVTDNDTIAVSNLNRQFLFREDNVGQKKSEAAGNRVKTMNKDIKVEALQEFVGESSEHIFNEKFWNDLSFVIPAVDNVKARAYIDQQCVFYEKPLIDSGTLGTKCNVVTVVPHLTQSYDDGSKESNDEANIPMCTLRNFPSLIDHCIEWSRSLFNDWFVEPCKAVNAFSDSKDSYLKDVENMCINESNASNKANNIQKYLELLKDVKENIQFYQEKTYIY